MKKLNQRTFSFVEVLVIIVALSLIVGAGCYIINNTRDTKTNNGPQTELSEPGTQTPGASSSQKVATDFSLVMYDFTQEKVKLSYDKNYWNVDSLSGVDDCGSYEEKADRLYLNHGDFFLGVSFGVCPGKGGDCDWGSVCKTESLKLGNIEVGQNKTWYLLATRFTNDYGKTWGYNIQIDNRQECDRFCSVTANINDGDIGYTCAGYRSDMGVSSLQEYAALPEVKEAITVLKTLRY